MKLNRRFHINMLKVNCPRMSDDVERKRINNYMPVTRKHICVITYRQNLIKTQVGYISVVRVGVIFWEVCDLNKNEFPSPKCLDR